MKTLIFSVLHFLTDGLCAFSMFAVFGGSEKWYLYVLLYDFAAFALQMLFGAVMDYLKSCMARRGLSGLARGEAENCFSLPEFCTLLGIFFTVAGAFLHPVILGIGNALFHVGGGIGTIEEDRKKEKKGALLGIFVAPGALGLFLGTFFGKSVSGSRIYIIMLLLAAVMLLSFLPLIIKKRPQGLSKEASPEGFIAAEERAPGASEISPETASKTEPETDGKNSLNAGAVFFAAALCFLVVVLRSYIGMAVGFSWKEGFLLGMVCTLAVVLGKMAGGILSAKWGTLKVMTVSLILSALGYLFSDIPVCGVLALFFFNMTMPITLYLLVDHLREFPGFSFGLLTLALFLGFLPVYAGLSVALPGKILGFSGSLLSLLLLIISLRLLQRKGEA